MSLPRGFVLVPLERRRWRLPFTRVARPNGAVPALGSWRTLAIHPLSTIVDERGKLQPPGRALVALIVGLALTAATSAAPGAPAYDPPASLPAAGARGDLRPGLVSLGGAPQGSSPAEAETEGSAPGNGDAELGRPPGADGRRRVDESVRPEVATPSGRTSGDRSPTPQTRPPRSLSSAT